MEEPVASETAGRRRRWRPLEPIQRLSLLAWPLLFLATTGVGLWLTPDPRGIGTHRQLGFPPCTTQVVFGIPCPFCGMTTAFSHMAHGHVKESFRCHPVGALAFLAFAVSAAAALAFAAAGRCPAGMTRLLESKASWAVGLALVVAGWVYKIAVSSGG